MECMWGVECGVWSQPQEDAGFLLELFCQQTPHFNIPRFTFCTLHYSKLYTPHSTPHIHSTLYTPHFTLQTLHSTLYTSHIFLDSTLPALPCFILTEFRC